MATLDRHHWYDLSEHRAWEDVISMILGVIVIISLAFFGASGNAPFIVSTGFVGGLIIALAMMEMVSLRRWEEWLEMACGAWLIASPFVFGLAGGQRTLHMVVGALVIMLAALELWQDRSRDFAR